MSSSPSDGFAYREFTAGAASGFFNVTLTFPINKVMFRQQIHNISPKKAFRQLKSEGALTLYRGVMSPLIMKVMSNSVMFGSYEEYSKWLHKKGGKHSQQVREFRTLKILAAILAGGNEALLLPLERVQVLMQDQKYHNQFKNTPHAFVAISRYGVTEYYRGLSAVLLRNCPSNAIFFTVREKIQDFVPNRLKDTVTSGLVDFFGGAFLGALLSTVFFPVNVTKVHMQLVVGGKFQRFSTVFRNLLEERGVRGMFRGVHVNYTRSFLSWGITNVCYEKTLSYLRTK